MCRKVACEQYRTRYPLPYYLPMSTKIKIFWGVGLISLLWMFVVLFVDQATRDVGASFATSFQVKLCDIDYRCLVFTDTFHDNSILVLYDESVASGNPHIKHSRDSLGRFHHDPQYRIAILEQEFPADANTCYLVSHGVIIKKWNLRDIGIDTVTPDNLTNVLEKVGIAMKGEAKPTQQAKSED